MQVLDLLGTVGIAKKTPASSAAALLMSTETVQSYTASTV
jgi:hypothetical protein